MTAKLNKTDYILLGIVIFVSALFNVWDYYIDGNTWLEFVVDIPVYMLMTCVALWGFIYNTPNL